MRALDSIILIIVGVVLGFLLHDKLFGWTNMPKKVEHQDQILLEKIKLVSKLITVEGQFSNIHNYKDYSWRDFSPLRKKAVVKVDAKVSVGYDLKKMTIETDPLRKKVIIKNIPPPEILSIDHNVSYYDMQEGLFNSFSEEDLNNIRAYTRQKLETEIKGSELMTTAKKEAQQIIDLIGMIVHDAGWEVEIQSPDFITPPTNQLEISDSTKAKN